MGRRTKWITPTVKQTWVVSSVLLNTVGLGMMLGFTSGLLTQLAAPDSTIKLSLDESSWIVSSLPMSGLLGYIPAAYFISKIGRRKSYLINTFPIVIGLATIIFATNYVTLLIGRIIFGLAAGSATTIGVIMVGEYTSPQYRGMFSNLKTSCLCIGILLVHIFGEYFYWRTVAALCVVPFIFSVGICYTWPESPSWLAERKKINESVKSFYWLRGESEDSRKEIEELIKDQSKKQALILRTTCLEKVSSFFGKFKRRDFLMPTLVFTFASIVIETSGRHIFPSYAAQLLKEMVTGDLNPFHFNMAIDVIVAVSCFISSYLVTLVNLRVLFFTSGIISFIVLNTSCFLLYLISTERLSKDFAWLPLLFFTIFFICSNLGCSSLPIVLMGEIFPLEHRSVGSSLASCMINITMSVNLKIMPYLVDRFEIYGAFAILGACLGISLIVLYFIMPETRNKTLLEIEYFFRYGKYGNGEKVDEIEKDHRIVPKYFNDV